jgi:hypothetical protein
VDPLLSRPGADDGWLGFGFGIIISSLTTKYRDLRFLVQFGVQLLMYATRDLIRFFHSRRFQWAIKLNPMTPIVGLSVMPSWCWVYEHARLALTRSVLWLHCGGRCSDV